MFHPESLNFYSVNNLNCNSEGCSYKLNNTVGAKQHYDLLSSRNFGNVVKLLVAFLIQAYIHHYLWCDPVGIYQPFADLLNIRQLQFFLFVYFAS